jgi:hypothetical protein
MAHQLRNGPIRRQRKSSRRLFVHIGRRVNDFNLRIEMVNHEHLGV